MRCNDSEELIAYPCLQIPRVFWIRPKVLVSLLVPNALLEVWSWTATRGLPHPQAQQSPSPTTPKQLLHGPGAGDPAGPQV